MALLFADPMGKFYATTAQALQGLNYTSISSVNIATSNLPAGAVETTAFVSASTVSFINMTLPASTTSAPFTTGVRVNTPSYPANSPFMIIFDSAGTAQASLYVTNTGALVAHNGNGGTTLGTASQILPLNGWNYVEFQIGVLSTTVGTLTVRMNNTVILNLSGVNTQAGNTTVQEVQWASFNQQSVYFQDAYFTDGSHPTGNILTGFLGDVAMPVLNANRAGAFNQYAPVGAAQNFQCVADVTPDDLVTYTSDSTPGDRVSFGYAGLLTSSPILGVAHVTRMQKSDSGARTAAQTLTSGGVDALSATISPGTSFAYNAQFLSLDPATGLPFTVTGLNNLQGGLKTVS